MTILLFTTGPSAHSDMFDKFLEGVEMLSKLALTILHGSFVTYSSEELWEICSLGASVRRRPMEHFAKPLTQHHWLHGKHTVNPIGLLDSRKLPGLEEHADKNMRSPETHWSSKLAEGHVAEAWARKHA